MNQWRIQGFSDREAPTPGDAYLLFGIIFAENYMKMKKKIGLRASFPTDPPMDDVEDLFTRTVSVSMSMSVTRGGKRGHTHT